MNHVIMDQLVTPSVVAQEYVFPGLVSASSMAAVDLIVTNQVVQES